MTENASPKPVHQGPETPNPLNTSEFTMKVKRSTNVHSLAGSVNHALENYASVLIRCLGAGPTQQAMKAIAVASGKERVKGYDLIVRASMKDESQTNGDTLTILILRLERIRI